MMMEKTEAEIVRHGRRKERTVIDKDQLKDWDSDCVSEII